MCLNVPPRVGDRPDVQRALPIAGSLSGTRMTPPILTHAGDLLARYDVLFCDVWGVIHDGLKAYPFACE